MEKLSPELEALITTVIYLDCRIRAIVDLLAEKGIIIPNEVIDAAAHKIHATDGHVKRHEIFCRIKDDNFDIR
jgi:SAM-dependent MidA family methyltransferase